MKYNKQIEEMAQTLVDTFNERRGRVNMKDLAESLHHAGYRKKSDVAREIFEEIEREIKLALKINNEEKNRLICSFFSYRMLSVLDSKIEVLQAASKVIAKLKKKYESEGEG